jgi:hypothetical protein
MRSRTRNGLLLVVIQVALVGSLGGKLLLDRATLPRLWVRTTPVDPDLPIRGRYVQLRIEAAVGPGLQWPAPAEAPGDSGSRRPGLETLDPWQPVRLQVEDGTLVAYPAPEGRLFARARERNEQTVAELVRPLAYFIPEDVPDPSRRPPGEELWVEVTVPRRGMPRPIQLGIRRDGTVTPMTVR